LVFINVDNGWTPYILYNYEECCQGNVPERAKGLCVFLLVIVPAEAEILVLCRSSPHDIVVLRQDEAGGFFPRTITSFKKKQCDREKGGKFRNPPDV
jgi:hypothetical protein